MMQVEKPIIQQKVRENLLQLIAQTGQGMYTPAGVSNRHVHLSREHAEILFGGADKLTVLKPLSQPDQFACEQTVIVRGAKGQIRSVRVLGPVRKETQVEISMTDSYVLGIRPMIRMSGDLKGTPGCILEGPNGQVEIDHGVIIAARHLHISSEQANAFGLHDREQVSVCKAGDRAAILENVIVRSGVEHALEFHIDTDEANAIGIRNGEILQIFRNCQCKE